MIPAEQQHPASTAAAAFYPEPSLMGPPYRHHRHPRHNNSHHLRHYPHGKSAPAGHQQQHRVNGMRLGVRAGAAASVMDGPKQMTTMMPYPQRRPLVSPSSPDRLLLLDEGDHGSSASSSSSSSSSSLSSSPSPRILQPPSIPKSQNTLHHHLPPVTPARIPSVPSIYYFTWLVFLHEKWVPFDAVNQPKLEQTLTLGGTFVDVSDTHFPKVKRVRVFPKNNYLSYLGVKYRLSRIMQPDAWLDHNHLVVEDDDDAMAEQQPNRENGGGGGALLPPWTP